MHVRLAQVAGGKGAGDFGAHKLAHVARDALAQGTLKFLAQRILNNSAQNGPFHPGNVQALRGKPIDKPIGKRRRLARSRD